MFKFIDKILALIGLTRTSQIYSEVRIVTKHKELVGLHLDYDISKSLLFEDEERHLHYMKKTIEHRFAEMIHDGGFLEMRELDDVFNHSKTYRFTLWVGK